MMFEINKYGRSNILFNNTKKQRVAENLDKNHVHYENHQLLGEEWCSLSMSLGPSNIINGWDNFMLITEWSNICWPGA